MEESRYVDAFFSIKASSCYSQAKKFKTGKIKFLEAKKSIKCETELFFVSQNRICLFGEFLEKSECV